MDAKASASTDTARLESLRQELRALEEKVWATKVLIEQEESSLAASGHEAQDLSAGLKDDHVALQGLISL